jgi:hypothetical protein
MNQTLRIGAIALLASAAGAAFAQNAVPGVPPAPTITIPPPPCEKPATTAGLDPDARARKRWQTAVEGYKKCVTDYAHDLGEQGKAYNAVANQLIDAGNKTVVDFNAYAAQVRKDNDADDDK